MSARTADPDGLSAAPVGAAPSIQARVDALMGGLGDGAIQSSAYPTAWAARLRADGQPVFPGARSWLLRHQHADGSWGGAVVFAHDRIVSTLAAILALAAGDDGEVRAARSAVDAGCAYLRRHGSDWEHDDIDTVGFELVVPLMLGEARQAGLPLPADACGELESLRQEKLRLIPRERLLSEPTTLLYSLEAVGELGPQAHRMMRFVTSGGSVANSVASTAAFWMATREPCVLAYLQRVVNDDLGFPEHYPVENFEKLWVLHSLERAGLTFPGRESFLRWLRGLVGDTGLVCYSAAVPLPDADDTAMALTLLLDAGYDVGHLLCKLLMFERDAGFATYPFEIGPSTTANARVLQALLHRRSAFAPQIRKIVDYLMDSREQDSWPHDKWHVSSLYATASVVFALAPLLGEELAPTRRWLIDSQHPNGSWGFDGGTPEETAYAVLALDALSATGQAASGQTWNAAAGYLETHLDDDVHPELFLAKGLYAPPNVVRSTVLAGFERATARTERARMG